MNEALRKAVEGVGVVILKDIRTGTQTVHLTPGMWRDVKDALRDQESALATHRANYDALVTRLGEVTARLEAAEGLLRECLSVMELHPATHTRITTHLKAADHV